MLAPQANYLKSKLSNQQPTGAFRQASLANKSDIEMSQDKSSVIESEPFKSIPKDLNVTAKNDAKAAESVQAREATITDKPFSPMLQQATKLNLKVKHH